MSLNRFAAFFVRKLRLNAKIFVIFIQWTTQKNNLKKTLLYIIGVL